MRNSQILVEMHRDLAEFVVRNCDSNISYALATMQKLENETSIREMASLLEKFKELKAAALRGIQECE